MVGMGNRDHYIGDEAQIKRGILALKYPISRGVIQNWDDIELLWKHIFEQELRITPSEHKLLCMDRPFTPRAQREKLSQIMFETFAMSGLYIAIDCVLDLYAAGRLTGLVLDCGEGTTCAVPIIEGYTSKNLFVRADYGGYEVTSYLARILREKGHNFNTSGELELVREMKEKYGFVAKDYQAELRTFANSSPQTKSYTCPDGKIITLDTELFRCSEVLFQPKLIGYDVKGTQDLVLDALFKSPLDTRADLLCNISLAGGSTLLPGFAERLTNELAALVPKKPRVLATPERKFHAWIGGSILACIPSFQNTFISKQDFDESGNRPIIHKCFG